MPLRPMLAKLAVVRTRAAKRNLIQAKLKRNQATKHLVAAAALKQRSRPGLAGRIALRRKFA